MQSKSASQAALLYNRAPFKVYKRNDNNCQELKKQGLCYTSEGRPSKASKMRHRVTNGRAVLVVGSCQPYTKSKPTLPIVTDFDQKVFQLLKGIIFRQVQLVETKKKSLGAKKLQISRTKRWRLPFSNLTKIPGEGKSWI